MRRSRVILGIVVLLACRGAAGRASPEKCAPVTADLPLSSTSAGLEGEYQLRLVATSGAKTGTAVEGTLTLQSQPEALRYQTRPGGAPDTTVSHPLYGSTDLDLAAVDAVSVGSTTSTDPMQPGVLVVERYSASRQARPATITIRLGSEANRRDRQRFDGGYTALRVRQVGPGRLAGSWSSGVTAESAAGYFCATRR
jgi:hypothetical protein